VGSVGKAAVHSRRPHKLACSNLPGGLLEPRPLLEPPECLAGGLLEHAKRLGSLDLQATSELELSHSRHRLADQIGDDGDKIWRARRFACDKPLSQFGLSIRIQENGVKCEVREPADQAIGQMAASGPCQSSRYIALIPPLQTTLCSMPGRISKTSPVTRSPRPMTETGPFLPASTHGTGLRCGARPSTSTENTGVGNWIAVRDIIRSARLFNASPVSTDTPMRGMEEGNCDG
jgi:hypothetical protein